MRLRQAISLILSQEPEHMWRTEDIHAAAMQYGSWSRGEVVSTLHAMARWDRPITVASVGWHLWQSQAPVNAAAVDLEWV